MLVHEGVVPEGLIIPVSAHMLHYDKALESYSKPLMLLPQYSKAATGALEVTNQNEVEGYFRYPDLTDQSIFLAQTLQATITEEMPQEL